VVICVCVLVLHCCYYRKQDVKFSPTWLHKCNINDDQAFDRLFPKHTKLSYSNKDLLYAVGCSNTDVNSLECLMDVVSVEVITQRDGVPRENTEVCLQYCCESACLIYIRCTNMPLYTRSITSKCTISSL
jgi:hypothetical protein